MTLDAAISELEAAARGSDWSAYWSPGDAAAHYPDYGPAMDRLWAAFAGAGIPFAPADYRAWLDRRPDPWSPAAIAAMDAADLAMLLLAARRGERFCDGLWVVLLEQGTLLAAARRLAELRSPPG